MGVNINSAFMLEGANLKYQIPVAVSCATPDPILESIRMFSEAKEELRTAKLEFYQMIEESGDILNEGVLEKVWTKITKIVDTVIKALVSFKNFVVEKIMGMAKKTQDENKKKREETDFGNVGELLDRYTDSMYFNINGYGLDKNGRKLYENPPQLAGWKFLEGFVSDINSIATSASELIKSGRANSLSENMNKLQQLIADETKIMCGEQNPRNFVTTCKEYLMGKTSSITINKETARRYFDAWNAKLGDNLLAQTTQEVKNAEQEYTKMINYLQDLKAWAEKLQRTEIINPNSVDAIAYKNVETNLSKIFAAVNTACTNIESLAMKHTQCISARFQCAATLNGEIIGVVNRVKSTVMRAANEKETNESVVYICKEDYELFDDALAGFCEGCAELQSGESRAAFTQYLNEHVLLVEAEAPQETIGDKLDKLIALIVNMFSKFAMSVNQFAKIDQTWFNNNSAKIKDPNFKFPQQDGNIDDWIPYNTDLISKKIEVDKFDIANADIMAKLESNDTFAAHILSKISGGNTTPQNSNGDGENGSFAAKCKAIYEGGDKQSIKVSEVQKNKDTYLNYCIDYMQGEQGGLFKSIIEDTKTLDESKKTALRELKDKEKAAEQAKKEQEAQKQQDKQQNSQSGSTTTVGQSSTPSPNSDAPIASQGAVKNEASTEEYGFNLARTLGINENSIIYELTMPKNPTSDASGNNSQAGESGNQDNNEFKVLKEKCTRYFNMMGNAVGARMSASIQCYKQYRSIFKWAVKGGGDNPTAENGEAQQQDDSIAGQGTAAAKS